MKQRQAVTAVTVQRYRQGNKKVKQQIEDSRHKPTKKGHQLGGLSYLKSWLPIADNLRNFLLTPTEMLSFFQHVISV